MSYTKMLDPEADVYTVKDFKDACETHSFIDYDGYGHPVKGGLVDESVAVNPSNCGVIPADATHVVWFNR